MASSPENAPEAAAGQSSNPTIAPAQIVGAAGLIMTRLSKDVILCEGVRLTEAQAEALLRHPVEQQKAWQAQVRQATSVTVNIAPPANTSSNAPETRPVVAVGERFVFVRAHFL